eukprot:gene7554-biopygen13109
MRSHSWQLVLELGEALGELVQLALACGLCAVGAAALVGANEGFDGGTRMGAAVVPALGARRDRVLRALGEVLLGDLVPLRPHRLHVCGGCGGCRGRGVDVGAPVGSVRVDQLVGEGVLVVARPLPPLVDGEGCRSAEAQHLLPVRLEVQAQLEDAMGSDGKCGRLVGDTELTAGGRRGVRQEDEVDAGRVVLRL